MKGLVLLLVVVLVVVLYGTWRGFRALAAARRKQQLARRPWEIAEESDGEQVRVLAAKPGEEPLLIGAVAFARGDFDQQLYLLRSEGREKVYALNERGTP